MGVYHHRVERGGVVYPVSYLSREAIDAMIETLTAGFIPVVDDTANWGAGFWRTVSTIEGITIGDNSVEGTMTIARAPIGTLGAIEFDLAGFTGGGGLGGLSVNNRIFCGTYGTVTGFEFNQTPYVGLNAIFHAGANKAAAQADSTAATVADLKADLNSLMAKFRAAGLMAP